jgi:signal recognition particle receptor subunit beta
MALINFARREIEVKIVFYGPALSGKTTNVEVLHRMMPPAQRGELHSLRTEQDRTLFFDYVPLRLGEIAGFAARFKLFTVPGQSFYKETRRVVLEGADAVVFVADSTPERAAANLDALVDLEANLRSQGLDLSSIPLVIQLNKRDAPGAASVEEMSAELNPFGVPVIEAVAAEGRGVLDTLRRVTDITAQRIRENLSGERNAVALTAVERAAPEDEREVVRAQMDAIRAVRPAEDAAVRLLQASGMLHAGQIDAVLNELVVRSEDVTPPEPLEPPDGPFDELPVPRDPRPPRAAPPAAEPVLRPRTTAPRGLPLARMDAGDATPVRALTPPRGGIAYGAPLDGWIDGVGARVVEVLGGSVAPQGEAQIELVADWQGERRRHLVTLHMGAPPAPEPPARAAPTPAPTPARPAPLTVNWVALGGAAVVAAIGGIAIGVGLGWITSAM